MSILGPCLFFCFLPETKKVRSYHRVAFAPQLSGSLDHSRKMRSAIFPAALPILFLLLVCCCLADASGRRRHKIDQELSVLMTRLWNEDEGRARHVEITRNNNNNHNNNSSGNSSHNNNNNNNNNSYAESESSHPLNHDKDGRDMAHADIEGGQHHADIRLNLGGSTSTRDNDDDAEAPLFRYFSEFLSINKWFVVLIILVAPKQLPLQ